MRIVGKVTRMHSTLEPRRVGPTTLEVPHRPIHSIRPNVRMTNAREKASAFFPRIMMHDSRRVKWVKQLNGLHDPYDHLVSFKQVASAEQVKNLHTKVEGFGLTLEGRALSWFQTVDL